MQLRQHHLLIGATAALFAFCVIGLGSAIKPLILAWAMAYCCEPIFEYFAQKGLPRVFSAFVILLCITFLLFFVIFALLPHLVTELIYFLKDFPDLFLTFVKYILVQLKGLGVDLSFDEYTLKKFITAKLPTVSMSTFFWVGNFVQSALGHIVTSVLDLIELFLFPVFFFYVAIYFKSIHTSLYSWLPASWVVVLEDMFAQAGVVMGGFIRGQLMISLFLSLYYALCLYCIGLKFAFLVGVCTGILSLIPYVGFCFGLFTACMIAIATQAYIWVFFAIVAIFFGAYMLEVGLLAPRLVGKRVNLNALSILLALMIGGNVMGIWGMLFCYSVAAFIQSYYQRFKHYIVATNWMTKPV